MALFRVNKNKNYTVMANYHLRDRNLSLKAKGLLSQMLSLPDDWDYTVNGLCAINKESVTAMQTTLKELETNGYLKRTRTQDGKGRFDYVYDIYENPYTENPYTENPCTESPCTENRLQLNTEKLNTEELNKDNIDTITKVIEQKAPKQFGNVEINELFDEWEKHCGFKIDTKVKQNRYACQRLLRSRGFERVKNVIPYVAESQADQYAPGINNFMDLAEKWNNLAVWYKKKKVTNTMKYGKIVIPTTNERNK